MHRAVELLPRDAIPAPRLLSLTTAAPTALSRKALVTAHDELCLQLLHCISRHAHTIRPRMPPNRNSRQGTVSRSLREMPDKQSQPKKYGRGFR